MDNRVFISQLISGLNQLEVKGYNNVMLLSFLMNLVNEYSNGLTNSENENKN